MKAVDLSDNLRREHRQVLLSEDFLSGAPDEWTAAAASGTVAADATRGGVLSLTTQAADNAEGTLTLDSKIAVVAANKPLYFYARCQYAEANTDDANVFIGLTSEAVATALGDDAAGPPASYSGVGFHKVDGGTRWIAEFSVAGTQKTVTLDQDGILDSSLQTAPTAGSASYVEFEINVEPKNSTQCDVTFSLDGTPVQRFLDQVYTSMAAMAPVVVIKAGGANAETIKIDLIQLAQVR